MKTDSRNIIYPVRNNAPLEFLTGFTYSVGRFFYEKASTR